MLKRYLNEENHTKFINIFKRLLSECGLRLENDSLEDLRDFYNYIIGEGDSFQSIIQTSRSYALNNSLWFKNIEIDLARDDMYNISLNCNGEEINRFKVSIGYVIRNENTVYVKMFNSVESLLLDAPVENKDEDINA